MFDDPRGLSLEPDRSTRHSIGIHASPAEVFLALTDPEELSHWFVSEASVDLRPGGAYRWVFGEATGEPGTDPHIATGEYTAVVKHELLRLGILIDGIDTELELRLDAWRDGTVVTLSHTGFPGDDDWDDTFRAFDCGWASELHVLQFYLERARGMVHRKRLHKVDLRATAEEVYQACTTTAGLEGWLADRAAAEPEPGGDLRLEWDSREPVTGNFALCNPERFILMIWKGERPSLVSIRLEGESCEEGREITEVRLEHRLFAPPEERFDDFDWRIALERLAAMLQGTPAR